MTFEMIFIPCGCAMRFVDYVTLELTARAHGKTEKTIVSQASPSSREGAGLRD